MKKYFFVTLFIMLTKMFAQPTAPVRMVAEWEPAFGTLIRWPLGLPSALVQELAADDTLYVLVHTNQQENSAAYTFSSWNVNMDNVVFIQAPTNSHWTRDWGPVSIFDGNGEYGIVDFHFDGYPWVPPAKHIDDNAVNSAVAAFFNVPLFQMPLYFTGGNVMTDGYGTTYSTEQMLSENEPLATPTEFFSIVENYTGTSNYHIVNNFESYGIQHIDCAAKLLNEETVLIKQVPEWHDDYERIESIAEQFSRIDNCFGRPYRIHRVFGTSAYTNSLILNKKVFVPLFDNDTDEPALQVYENAMPGYEIIGIYHNAWYNFDALHCRTMGIFDREMLHLAHRPLDSHIQHNEDILISVQIKAHSNQPLIESELNLYWRNGNEEWQTLPLALFEEDTFQAIIPSQPIHSYVQYYITASDESGRTETLPRTAPAALYSFLIFDGTSTDDVISASSIDFGNYPNPFNPSTTIHFSKNLLALDKQLEIEIVNIKGQRIKHFKIEENGTHSVVWDGTDENRNPVVSGIYFALLRAEGKMIATTKCVLLK